MRSELKAFFRSFTYAAEGIVNALRTERNMRFHACAAVTVIVFSRIYGLTRTENCIMLLCIGLVIGAELMNTAVEAAADIMSQGEISPEA
ncbi:MAG: diacylglycerol kinase family protein, partial [Oscillospiraceae bacterium]|nr:diacylglycerol kinase family protein [Oscillospiraceae bacterium]